MKHTYYKYRLWLNIIKKDLKDKFPISIFLKISLWKKGFLAEKYTLYQLDKNNYKDYLSDHHTSMARYINEPFNDILTNKLIFGEIVGQFIKVPKTYGWIFNGVFFNKTNLLLIDILSSFDTFVVKAVTGGGGKGVFIISKKKDNLFIVNNTLEFSTQKLTEFISSLDNYILTEFIKPSEFVKSLNHGTINTMRIITMLDPKTNRPFIARAVQRIGVNSSAPMDNFTKGGLSASIDLNSGKLGDATCHPKTKNHIRYSSHPNTNINFEGKIIPKWKEIKQEILKGASNLPMLKCVGWDFLLSDKGLVAIEGNHHPDPDVLQGHGPILTDKRIKAFYKHYNII